MIIGIEGPDLAGKTTLFEVMKKDPFFSSWKFVSLGGVSKALHEHVEEYSEFFAKTLYSILSEKENYVFDRFMVSDFVYGRLYNRKFPGIMTNFLVQNSFYIYLHYDPKKKKFKVKDKVYDLEAVRKIATEYNQFFFKPQNFYGIENRNRFMCLDCTEFRVFENDLLTIRTKIAIWKKYYNHEQRQIKLG